MSLQVNSLPGNHEMTWNPWKSLKLTELESALMKIQTGRYR